VYELCGARILIRQYSKRPAKAVTKLGNAADTRSFHFLKAHRRMNPNCSNGYSPIFTRRSFNADAIDKSASARSLGLLHVLQSATSFLTPFRKPCTLCQTPYSVLIRCQIGETGMWHFVCTGKCWAREGLVGAVDAAGQENEFPALKVSRHVED
jgi:hypothetical protein